MTTKIQPVKRAELITIKMVAGGENRHPKVIDGDIVKQWVGIGWVDEGKATEDDYLRYPTIID